MGHKVNPTILRMPYLHPWKSRWFSKKEYAKFLEEDIKIRNFLKGKLKEALLDNVEIERSTNKFTIIIHATRPGLIIGRGGAGIEDLKKEISKKVLRNKQNIEINIQEVKKSMQSARVLLQSMAFDIEKRIPFRKVMKQAISKALKDGAKGIKVMVSGRLNGVDIARSETLSNGKIPLHTIRADIDYAAGVANTTYGVIGIKVWVYKGEIFKKNNNVKYVNAKKVKHRKWQKGRIRGQATKRNRVCFGRYGLMSLDQKWISSRQIEATRRVLSRHLGKVGKVWIRIFPDKPVTQKGQELPMGKGKGAPEYFVAVVKPGMVLFEIDGVPFDAAKKAIIAAAHKLPVKAKFVEKI